jgi:hypothetical protein
MMISIILRCRVLFLFVKKRVRLPYSVVIDPTCTKNGCTIEIVRLLTVLAMALNLVSTAMLLAVQPRKH